MEIKILPIDGRYETADASDCVRISASLSRRFLLQQRVNERENRCNRTGISKARERKSKKSRCCQQQYSSGLIKACSLCNNILIRGNCSWKLCFIHVGDGPIHISMFAIRLLSHLPSWKIPFWDASHEMEVSLWSEYSTKISGKKYRRKEFRELNIGRTVPVPFAIAARILTSSTVEFGGQKAQIFFDDDS